jgi:hypothetical protein
VRIVGMVSALVCIVVTGIPLSAADLSRVERKIAQPPVCKGKPRYCLLVFGPEARLRVWLVHDGETLHVDRNGNGDLTEPGEKVAARKGEDGELSFAVGDLRDGKRTHRNLRVGIGKLDHLAGRDEAVKRYLARDPRALRYSVSVEVEMPGRKGAGTGGRVEHAVFFRDTRGFLKFADRPQDAPIIHLGGPWQVTLFDRQQLRVGREKDLVVGVGTPGVGPGTTAYVAYEGLIPERAYPTLEVTYPPRRAGDRPIRELYELKERC